MAGKIVLFESYLNCHVCAKTFRDPVSLSCQHSFCSSCLKQFWEQSKNKNCPICKRKPSNDNINVNFTLKELADSFAGRQKAETEKGEEKVEVVCREHKAERKWFCRNEQRAVCAVCEFPLHHGHKVVPIEEAVSELKEQLKSDLKSLQDKKNKCKEVKKLYKEMGELFKKQLVATERQIRAEFNKLHQFLKEEEEARLAALREEEERKRKTVTRKMKMIEEKISSLSDIISAVEKDLQKHNVPFLSSYKSSQSSARAQCSQPDPQLVSGALIDVAKHLGNLSFRVWEKMKDKVKFSPVILDPNTASPWLYLSDDLTSVRHGDTKQKLPDNPERNINYATVLGSEGFSSGKHSWEVEVGDLPHWNVGLAKESVDRKGELIASPKYGIWCLVHDSGKYSDVLGNTVTVNKRLQRIRVQLDYDRGKVSFYDSDDMTNICNHRDTFTEKLYPYFSVGEAADAKIKHIKVLQTEPSVILQ
ncbi:zinc-binding protein A33-like [Myripristis murdjan]|uniref:zinc-binding protein A33-like n=1 Tax=Myripristis murdjan TaxID=586833 RepID=UPI00117610B1|nr:zinc-binding protein A33-like [Myripristis murdjan]